MPSLEIRSVDSIPPIRYRLCEKNVELPWDRIQLPDESSYIIKDIRKIEEPVKVVAARGSIKGAAAPAAGPAAAVAAAAVATTPAEAVANITPAKAKAFACSCDCCQDADMDESGCGCPDCPGQAGKDAATPPSAVEAPAAAPAAQDASGPACTCNCCDDIKESDQGCSCSICQAMKDKKAPCDSVQPTPANGGAAGGGGGVARSGGANLHCTCGCCVEGQFCPRKPKPKTRRKKQKIKEQCPNEGPFLYTNETLSYSEPYMEELCIDMNPEEFGDADGVGKCGSKTEMPWQDILIPPKIVIQKAITKMEESCTC